MVQKKVLLVAINAKYIHVNLAVYSLLACAGPYREAVSVREYTINQEWEEILRDLYSRHPDVLAFSVYIWNSEMVKILLRELPKVLPEMEIWLGGPEASNDADGWLRDFPGVKGIMLGEGEATFRELLSSYWEADPGREADSEWKAYSDRKADSNLEAYSDWKVSFEGDRTLSLIPGILFREQRDCFIQTKERPLVDLSQLPFPYDSAVLGGEIREVFAHRILYYESSRGCPFRCSYCLSSVDKQVRLRDLSLVLRELQIFLDQKVSQVKFVDRTFNCYPAHTKAIWEYLRCHDNGVTNFHFEITAELLNPEEIALLASLRPGLVQLEIGVQSVNPRTLAAIERPANLEKLWENVDAIAAGKNVHQHLDLIAGLPYEDFSTYARSFDVVYAHRPNQLQCGFLKVLRGSPLYEKREEYGLIFEDRVPYEVLGTKWLGYGDLCRLKLVEEMVEQHYNSGQFVMTLSFLSHHMESAFSFYLEMGEYYQDRGWLAISHARIDRYEHFYQFLSERYLSLKEVAAELLLYDYLVRENAKTRPSFAINSRREDTKKKRFYHNPDNILRYLPDCKNFSVSSVIHMTNLEVIQYDPDHAVRTGEAVLHPAFLLFDYQERDPITGNVRVVRIPFEDVPECMEELIS